MNPKLLEILKALEGLQTIETAAKALNLKPQSTLNLLSRLKKQGYLTTSGGGKIKRLYKITVTKQRARCPGMFDIINKYSPHMKLAPWYDHQVHGIDGPEEALIDAIGTQSFRVILESMHLFNHITNWPKLYLLAKKNDNWQKIGALYDVAKMFMKVRRMPEKYTTDRLIKNKLIKKQYLIKTYPTKETIFKSITKKWSVAIPFRIGDITKGVV